MKKLSVVLIIFFVFEGCTKTITPNLNNGPAQLLIQGAISDTTGPYYVSILNSVEFYADNIYPGVSGANITITDSTTGLKDMLTETTSGLYVTHLLLLGVSGHTYVLNVSLNGKTFTASSTMPKPVLLDSISFDTTDKKRIRAVANYQDPIGFTNFYKYSLIVNHLVDNRFQTFDDRLSNGKYIHDKVDADTSEIKHNDEVQLNLVCVDPNVYTYLHEAENVAYSNDNLVSPATPVSNISGGCLGYFSAQSVSSKQANVK